MNKGRSWCRPFSCGDRAAALVALRMSPWLTFSRNDGCDQREITVATGGIVMSGVTQAASSKRIEQLDAALEKIISLTEPIHDLADGFGGSHGPAEGPLWWREGGYLLFSDIHNNKRMKYVPDSGVSLFQEPTNR